jgi:hypothetical protein
MENFVGQFYDLVKSTPVEYTQKLNSFVTDFDLENVLAENESLDIDLSKLLGLNSTTSNSDS